jgi:hypothetical protein
MSSALGILWRGPLDSCNYGCGYCPFAKRAPSRRVLDADREALARFVTWVRSATAWRLQLLFTPYGEALIWPWYQEALVALSRLPHIEQVTIQTNASGPMAFLERADRERLSLWISWHPSEIARADMVAKVTALHAAGTRLSVGLVAAPARIDDAEALRAELPPEVPMWLNAQKPGVRFSDADRDRLLAIDPAFELEVRRHQTRGRPCNTGEDVISVDGDGTVRRCHFVDEVLGNLYSDALETLLRPRVCPRATCECFIGYVNVPALGMREQYGAEHFLARMRSAADAPRAIADGSGLI